jgi:opacity protein-like surface antigen
MSRRHDNTRATPIRAAAAALTALAAALGPGPRALGQAESQPPAPPLPEDPAPPPFISFDPNPPHHGFYFRGSGLAVEPQDDARLIDGSGSVDTDDGYGLTIALGYRDLATPLCFEFEYAYRDIETDDYIDPNTMLLGDSEIDLHTLSANILFDQPDLIGPVGFYAGIGAGFHINKFRFSSSGGQSTTAIHGEGFFWQLMAGVTVSIGPQAQLYGGVRWSDADDLEEDALRLDGEFFEIEIGARIFF